MTELPIVSIIMPVLNAERDVRVAIKCLLSLDYPKELIEIIVVDNGSTDRTREVATEYPVTLLVEASAKNAYTARNAALRKARGSVIAFTDADCIIDPQWLRAGLKAMEDHGAHMVGGRIIFTFPGGETAGSIVDSLLHLDNERWVRSKGCAVTANLIVRKTVFDAIGLFPDDVAIGGDFKWTAAAVSRGFRIVYAPDAVVHHPARGFRALLAKKYSIGRVYEQWPGLEGPSRGSVLFRLSTSFVPAPPGWILRLIQRRGTPSMQKKWISVLWVMWLANVWWATGAIISVLEGAGKGSERSQKM